MMGRRGPFVGRERMDVLRGGRGQDHTWGEEDWTGTVHGMQNNVSEPFMGEKIEKKDRKFIGGGGSVGEDLGCTPVTSPKATAEHLQCFVL